ncbi:hypothetical protein FRC02_008667 [Tulasnella sp. 418]|nr:hypothetical protein FRC02_008667 [Tulasnella sp. 418]
MPYLESKELAKDKIQLWYTTNLRNDNIAYLDRSKPTIILLHGMFLDTRFLAPQMADPRLKNAFNLIAFDSLSCGKTKNPVHSGRDLWCDAALLAIFMETLKLPPCHIMANGMNPVAQALKFAMLFKDRCLSLNLVGIPGALDQEWCAKAYGELLQLWAFAPDLETVEESCNELSYFLFCEGILTTEQQDEAVACWQRAFPPCRRTHLLDVASMISGRVPHTQAEFDLVTCPVLLVTGDSSPVHTVEMAEELQTSLRNARGGCKLQVVRGGTENLQLPAPFASLVNRYLLQFVTSVENEGLPPRPPQAKKISEVMKPALELLSQISGDPKMRKREAKSIWSFSRVPPEGVAGKDQFVAMFKKGEREAFNPCDKDGEPIRRFSERHHNQLFLSPQHVSD